MKNYFKRLKDHAGIEMGVMLPVLGFFAGGTNKSFSYWWQGGIFGFIIMAVFCWSIILITNIKSK
jgi:hypothetical protein